MSAYSESQWRAIDALGHRVDEALAQMDVRLTQGGEPTFVAATGGDAPEWNIAADGPGKRVLAGRLLRRLRDRFAPGALLYFGQGKWYPGEALPRWAFGLFWRKDGTPLWNDPRLIADEKTGASHDIKDARRLTVALAKELGIAADRVIPAYEDPWPALAAKSRVSGGLARQLKKGVGTVKAYVLPLAPAARKARGTAWRSGRWPQKLGRLYLAGGDSPAGYRLPLDKLPAGKSIVRTALCVQARGGRLQVFIPPLDVLEDYVALVTAIEQCACALELPVIPEGYEPPPGGPLSVLKVTPDPGVIEVNVHPAADWDELSTITHTVYDEARALGLVAEKFTRDGRKVGTGGGSHITLGGASFAESPLLRRPEVLASLVAYWQNHPALSYLFSGQYIGPTSQAPRVDEARHDSLYELEITFQQLRRMRHAGTVEPEQIDRLLRNLLVDVTGNTHRAEFCVDKLASPDGPAGKLGLLELRAFEMAPNSRMALVQFLLVRSLVARFWKTPFQGRPIHWGTALHDRFMLPHFLGADMREVLAELKSAGYAFEFDWLAPFFEFRFPLCGTVSCGPVALQLRHALEPWPVLGEAATSTGTSRAVDASLDRVEVRLSGMDADRHVLLCNGRRVPLHAAGAVGEHVAGIRFRARTFPSMLHPTIGVHAPLAFDVVEASGKHLGGCTYHSAPPPGKDFGSLPASAAKAEARRKMRFVARSLSKRAVRIPPETPDTHAPFTLDLRFQHE